MITNDLKKIVPFLLWLLVTSTVFAQVVPSTVKMGAKSSFVEFLGGVKADSNFVLPVRPAADTLNKIYKLAGNLFFDNTNGLLRYYNGTQFSPLLVGDGSMWNLGGNTIGSSDSAIGTIDDRSLIFLQNNFKKLVITREGYVGINNEDPKSHLDVNGIIRAKGAKFDRVLSATLPTTYSDARFKTKVQTLNEALPKVLQLRGVSYLLKVSEFPDKGFTNNLHAGLIAQEVEKVIPEVVTNEADGYKSVSYTMLTPYLIEAIKTQQQSIEELKKQIEAQQKQIEALLRTQNKK